MGLDRQTNKFIPQDSVRMKERQELLRSLYKTETALAEAMVQEMRLHNDKAWIDQPGVSRILNGREAATTLELLVLSKLFQTTMEELLMPALRPYCVGKKANTPKLRKQQTALESDEYLAQLEAEGRILAFSEFPSQLFSMDIHPKRKAQVMQSSYKAFGQVNTPSLFPIAPIFGML